MLTSRLRIRFFGGAAEARSRSFCSCARETEIERDRERRILVVRVCIDATGDGKREVDAGGSAVSESVPSPSVSEKGEEGNTLERNNEQRSGSCDLKLHSKVAR